MTESLIWQVYIILEPFQTSHGQAVAALAWPTSCFWSYLVMAVNGSGRKQHGMVENGTVNSPRTSFPQPPHKGIQIRSHVKNRNCVGSDVGRGARPLKTIRWKTVNDTLKIWNTFDWISLKHKRPTQTCSLDSFHLALAYTMTCSHTCVYVPMQNSQMDHYQRSNYITMACYEQQTFNVTVQTRKYYF